MKKILIGGLVGGLILFIWQSLSWTMLNIHGSQTSYTPAQDKILDCIKANNLEEGEYFLPTVAPGTSTEDEQSYMQESIGKPWATLTYHKAMQANFGLNMIRGLIINIISVGLLCFVLLGDPTLTFKKVITACPAVAAICYMTEPYLFSIWFQNNTIPDLIDNLVQWTLAGLFLAWYLPAKKAH